LNNSYPYQERWREGPYETRQPALRGANSYRFILKDEDLHILKASSFIEGALIFLEYTIRGG